MSKDELLTLIIQTIPYPQQIKEIDTTTEDDAIQFTWRACRYRVSDNRHVEEVGDGVLIGSDRAILMGHLLLIAEFGALAAHAVGNYEVTP